MRWLSVIGQDAGGEVSLVWHNSLRGGGSNCW
jgi:hypothetical protein